MAVTRRGCREGRGCRGRPGSGEGEGYQSLVPGKLKPAMTVRRDVDQKTRLQEPPARRL